MPESNAHSHDIRAPVEINQGAINQGPSRLWLAVMFLLLWAVVLFGVSFLIPGHKRLVVVESFQNWFAFGQRILRDTLRAASVLCLAMAVSAVLPGVGLWIERLVFRSSRAVFLCVMAGIAFLSSAAFSYFVYEHFPFVQDEIANVFQAKVFASGRLYADAPELYDFFDWEFIITDGTRWYGKYFFGQSLLFALGVMTGLTWLVNPILSGVATLLTYGMGCTFLNEKLARVGTLLFAFSPYRVDLFAIMMAHPTCLVSLAVFAWGWSRVVLDPRRTLSAAAAGIGAGFAFNTRPLTTVAIVGALMVVSFFSIPWRQVRWQAVVAFVLPLVVFALLFLGYNQVLTGDMFMTPFEKWSPKDRLGFGPDVGLEYWPLDDRGHSLHKALFRNSYYNLDALGKYLLGWGRVALILLIYPMVRSPWPRKTLPLTAAVVGLIFAYLFYHHSDPNPAIQARYWSEAAPMMALLVAVALLQLRRTLPRVCRWMRIKPAVRVGRASIWLAGALLVASSIPLSHWPLARASNINWWGQGDQTRLRDLLKKNTLTNALVFVKADHYLDIAETFRPDTYGFGFELNTVDLDGPVVFVRDLGDRNQEVIARYPDRDVYRFVPGFSREGDRFDRLATQAGSSSP